MSEVADVLRAAKALIDTPEKWSHGASYGPNGGRCAGIALTEAYCALPLLRSGAFADVLRAFGHGDYVWDIGAWNDAPERTHADVMAAFDRAIMLAEAA